MRPAARRGSGWRLALATSVFGAGLLNLASAIFPAERARFATLRGIVPLAATHVATSATTIAGAGLLVLARQLRRGKRRAMVFAAALLGASVILHVLKGLDVEEAAVAAALAALLLLRRGDFPAESDPASLARFVRTVPLLVAGWFAFGVAALWVNRGSVAPGFGIGAALEETFFRMGVSSGSLRLTGRFGVWFPWAMGSVGIGTLAFSAFLLFRPVVVRLHQRPEEREAARRLARAHDEDSLSYFTLRSDKDYFFNSARTAFVAYRYVAGLALVSGDPIGPGGEWPGLLEEFSDHCRRHDWRIAVVGVPERSLPLYRGFGFRSYPIGDEAILNPQTFSLEGRHVRNIRQSANHVRKQGYRFRLLDLKELDLATRRELIAISHRWRGAVVERGFSMALGRLLAAEDPGVLAAVAEDANGRPQGFLQFVPFRSRRGYSLDVMRRNRSAPAGLNEYLICETAAAMRDRGVDALSLNFAAFAAQIAPAPGFHPVRGLQRRAFLVLSRFFQIESLLKFNRKFDPEWVPRHLVYEELLDLPRAGLAILQAEAFLRLPVVGRYF
ncbi:MAG: DUF2156 domain-containing protein [Acidobacteria bacterium]|nr:DUF2156 domain-containing protein [Acidobacteriota bacterium]